MGLNVLIGFEDEMGSLAKDDEVGGGGAIGVGGGDGAIEDVVVFGIVGSGGVGEGEVEEVAQFREEELVVGAFGAAGGLPASGERGRVRGRRSGEGHCDPSG